MTADEPPQAREDGTHLRQPGENGKVRVLLVDGSPITQMGVRMILDNFADLELVGVAYDERNAVESSRLLNPDVILVNSLALSQDSLNSIIQLFSVNPELPPRTLIIVSHRRNAVARPANAGADGFVLIQAQPRELAAAISLVAAGYSVAAPTGQSGESAEPRRVPSRPGRTTHGAKFDALTQRELDVLDALAQGWTNAEIAKRLVLSESTVKSHVQSLLTKLGLRNRASAVALAYEAGMIRANPG